MPARLERRVLVVDDDPAMRDMVATHLSRFDYQVITCASTAEALAVPVHAIDVVVADVRMPERDGIELCTELHARAPALPIILITAFGSMETAIAALRAGAFDFLPKPFRIDALVAAIVRAIGHRPETGLVGASAPMVALAELVARFGPSDAPVLITGESGTGKELVARALHAASPRAAGPLVAVNCAAMPAALLESELFGHTRGAFTDARTAKRGLFEVARGGTLVLDELGELPLELQPKLLRVLQERVVRPIGATAEVPIDVRIVTATNRDLEAMIAAGQFREDLWFRVHVLHIAVPPLRTRAGDPVLLARHFARDRKQLSPEALALVAAYSWPGNVRELENAIEHAVAISTTTTITVADLPERVRASQPRPPVASEDALATLEALERDHVARVLERVAGNKAAAARILGIERKTLYRMLERWQT